MQKKWIVFTAVAIMVALVDLGVTAANLALTEIAGDLKSNLTSLQWVINGYMIAAATFIGFAGRLNFIYGSRKIFIAGLWAFIISSAVVGFSHHSSTLIFGRIIQGACVAFIFPISMILMREIFEKEEHALVIGSITGIATLSQALGPTVGGIIMTLATWRAIFLINIPLAFVAWLLIKPHLRYQMKSLDDRMDVFSLVLLGLGLFFLVALINEATNWGFSDKLLTALCVSIATIVGFVARDLISDTPTIDFRLLKFPSFSIAISVRFIVAFIYFTLLFSLGFYMQNMLHFSPMEAGMKMLALTLAIGILTPIAGVFMRKIAQPRWVMILGMLLLAFGIFAFVSSLNAQSSIATLSSEMFVCGIAIALIIPASGTMGLMSSPAEKTPAASCFLLTTTFVGGALGVAITGGLLDYLSTRSFVGQLAQMGLSFSKEQMNILIEVSSGVYRLKDYAMMFTSKDLSSLQMVMSKAFVSGLSGVMVLCGLMSILGLIISFAVIKGFATKATSQEVAH